MFDFSNKRPPKLCLLHMLQKLLGVCVEPAIMAWLRFSQTSRLCWRCCIGWPGLSKVRDQQNHQDLAALSYCGPTKWVQHWCMDNYHNTYELYLHSCILQSKDAQQSLPTFACPTSLDTWHVTTQISNPSVSVESGILKGKSTMIWKATV